MGRRGPRGDVTSSAPGGRNRAAAAAAAQQRAAAAQRAGVATTFRAPGTRRQSERPTEGRGTGSPSPLPPRGAPAHGSLATWSSPQLWPPQVRELAEGAKSPPPTSSSAPCWGLRARCPAPPRRAWRGRLHVLSARAARANFTLLAGSGRRTTGPGLGKDTPAGARTHGKGWSSVVWGPGLQ